MGKQFKYSVRNCLMLRSVALFATIAINIVFAILGYRGLGVGWKITAVTISGMLFTALLCVNLVADVSGIRSLFTAPAGYHFFLTPVPRWKILFAHALPMVVFDIVSFVVGALCVTVQTFIMADLTDLSDVTVFGDGFEWMSIALILYYILFILLLFFVGALCKSLFYRLPCRGLLGFLSAVLVVYLFNLADFALIPFGAHSQYGMLHTVNLDFGLNAGMFAFFILLALKAAALFFGTVYLMERKINI